MHIFTWVGRPEELACGCTCFHFVIESFEQKNDRISAKGSISYTGNHKWSKFTNYWVALNVTPEDANRWLILNRKGDIGLQADFIRNGPDFTSLPDVNKAIVGFIIRQLKFFIEIKNKREA